MDMVYISFFVLAASIFMIGWSIRNIAQENKMLHEAYDEMSKTKARLDATITFVDGSNIHITKFFEADPFYVFGSASAEENANWYAKKFLTVKYFTDEATGIKYPISAILSFEPVIQTYQ